MHTHCSRSWRVLQPLGNEPERLSVGNRDAIVMPRLDAYEAESQAQGCSRAPAPGDLSKQLLVETRHEFADARRLRTGSSETIDTGDAEIGTQLDSGTLFGLAALRELRET